MREWRPGRPPFTGVEAGAVARAGFAGRRRESVPELLNSSDTGCADSTVENVGSKMKIL
jgi:hypothetical protein